MTRRRLALVAVVLLALVGTAVFFRPDLLTAEERPFVGVWRVRGNKDSRTLMLAADHRFTQTSLTDNGPASFGGYWQVRSGRLALDLEPRTLGRVLRPTITRLGFRVTPAQVKSIATEEFDLDGGTARALWVRVNPD